MKTLYKSISTDPIIFQTGAQKKALRKAISRLPEDQQKVLDLYYNQQLPVSEISKHLKCSATTTYLKLNRALIALRNEFNPAAYQKMNAILYPETGQPMKL